MKKKEFFPLSFYLFVQFFLSLPSSFSFLYNMPHGASTRWCPTPEQVMILEEMYKGGIITPNTSQIQQITAHLSFYGKIEGKNVFYWFQNHKARDRQKLRRSLFRQKQQQQHQPRLLQQQPIAETSSLSLSSENPPHFLHQGRVEEAAQAMNFGCKLDSLDMKDKEKPSMDYGHDCMMMMMDMGSDPSYRPLKTLELFPTKSTGSTSTD